MHAPLPAKPLPVYLQVAELLARQIKAGYWHSGERLPTEAELAQIPWLPSLGPVERERALEGLVVTEVPAGDYIIRFGRSATYWFGLVDGLLKMNNDESQGFAITFTGLAPGGWFGEGTVLKREPYRYNVQAIRKSVVAGLPIDTFHWLLDHSIGFNRFVMSQLNERLGQFISAREIDRLTNPDLRVARSLAALFHPLLYPGVGEVLRITQQELAYLVGLSRQRVNEALAALEADASDFAQTTAATLRKRSPLMLAVVLEQNAKSLLVPKVKAFFLAKSKVQIPPVVIDLGKPTAQDRIVGRESAAAWGFENLDELWSGMPQQRTRR